MNAVFGLLSFNRTLKNIKEFHVSVPVKWHGGSGGIVPRIRQISAPVSSGETRN